MLVGELFMSIRYQKNLHDVSWNRISELFQSVGWGIRSPEDIKKTFNKSTHVRIAYAGSNIVAFGRTIDDGKYYAVIVDLVVDPLYQKKGIGKKILSELRDELKDYIVTTLTAAPGRDNFYLQQGWKRQTSAFIWPRSSR